MELNVATAAKPVKIPGPDHPITIERNPARVIVSIAGRVVADTREALTLREAAYPAVQYMPRKDVDTELLDRTDAPPTALTRGIVATSAFRSAASVRSMLCGVMRPHTLPSCRSRIISPSTPSVLTRSKNDQRPDHPSLCQIRFWLSQPRGGEVRKWHIASCRGDA